jgi:asparagine synthase (glutamine-hydrolysing)
MCGIAGAITREGSPSITRVTRDLTTALAHRGPDGAGLWSLGDDGRSSYEAGPEQAAVLALGHRRLSIVDVTNGAQPMPNEDGSVVVSFNGEIYNFVELRRELEAAGHRFRTRADTEVLVHGWEEWGATLFERLNGIFAVALADARHRRVVLARDPLGVKPLFIGATDDGMTWWSSELRAAVSCGLTGREVASDALRLFLTLRFIPSPMSIYRNAAKVPPGHYCLVAAEQSGVIPEFHRYSSRIRSDAAPRGAREWREAMAIELNAAVSRQMMSDVPVGNLLSGGVDSAVVATLMKQASPTAPQCFAIGFRSDEIPNESMAARDVAAELGLPLTAVEVTPDSYRAAWPDAIQQVDEPVGNPGQLLVGLLCEKVRLSHKVVLSGQGADEPLGGYPRHMAERLWRLGRYAPRASAWAASRLLGDDAGERLSRVLAQRDRIDRIVDILAVMAPEDVDALMRVDRNAPTARDLARAAIRRWAEEASDEDSLNALLKVDARMSLADDLLLIADHFSMRSSVELRVPFLDLAFVELVERMPSRYKVSVIGERKWLYRSVARQILPAATGDRLCGITARLGRKQGFSTPSAVWSAATKHAGPIADFIDWQKVNARQNDFSVRQRIAFASLSAWGESAA